MEKQLRQAVILAGGRGERLRPITDTLPKPMAPVLGRPFLDYLLYSLAEAGIQKVLLLVGYKYGKIIERYKSYPNINIEFSIGRPEDETLQRVLQAKSQLDDIFMLIYGDNYWPLDLVKMEEFFHRTGSACTTTVFTNREGTAEYGKENNIKVDENMTVLGYDKKRQAPGLNGVDIGYFIFRKSILEGEFGENPSLENELLPRLVEKRELNAFLTDKQYYYITSLESLKNFENTVSEKGLRPLSDL